MVNTPVLFITFARPEYARQSFDAIKKVQPRKLYFYSNKAREDKPDEVKRNEEVRSYVKEIDWNCEIKTWFRDEYVDMFTSLWGAMDWLFDNEEKGIVLEEDCVASEAFFIYCEKMLEFYKDDKRVSIISGNNRYPDLVPEGVDFFLTKMVDIYGWANWVDRWKSLDRNMTDWPKSRMRLFKYFGRVIQALWRMFWFERVYRKIDHYNPWDVISSYNRAKDFTYGIVPICDLVKDVGTYGENHHAKANNSQKEDTITISFSDNINIYNNCHKHDLQLYNRYERKSFSRKLKKSLSYLSKRFLQKYLKIDLF